MPLKFCVFPFHGKKVSLMSGGMRPPLLTPKVLPPVQRAQAALATCV